MTPDRIRARTIETLLAKHLPVPRHLPLLDGDLPRRDLDAVINRTLVLNCVVAVSFGFDHDKCQRWLISEKLDSYISDREKRFLNGESRDTEEFKKQVESLWALTWVLGSGKDLNPWVPCPQDLVKYLPNLKAGESSSTFRRKSRFRDKDKIEQEFDTYYCLHWALIEKGANRHALSSPIAPYVIINRRWSLEWVLGVDLWDEISLDT